MKNLVFALSAAALVSAAPLQAQAFSTFTANNDGVEFWDNLSDDNATCNSGYVVTGVAPITCINQRPNTWLPYTGLPATTYLNNGGNWTAVYFSGGDYSLDYLGGTPSRRCVAPCVGGDIAGANLGWGIFDLGNRTTNFTNFNTGSPLPVLGSDQLVVLGALRRPPGRWPRVLGC